MGGMPGQLTPGGGGLVGPLSHHGSQQTLQMSKQQVAQVMHLKALFDYDPDQDLYIPCRELGIAFTRGTYPGLGLDPGLGPDLRSWKSQDVGW